MTVIEREELTSVSENGSGTATGTAGNVPTKVPTIGSRDVPGEFAKWFEADTGGWPTLIVCVTLAVFIAAVALL